MASGAAPRRTKYVKIFRNCSGRLTFRPRALGLAWKIERFGRQPRLRVLVDEDGADCARRCRSPFV